MEKINNRNAARNIKVCDFTTLYTKIPPTDLNEKTKGSSTKGLQRRNEPIHHSQQEECTLGQQQRWTNLQQGTDISPDRLGDWQSFFRFGKKVFKQKIGIPMCLDPAPQMANLYLYYYKAAFMEKLTKQDYSKAKKFNNTLITQVASLMILERWTKIKYWWKKRKRSIQWSWYLM